MEAGTLWTDWSPWRVALTTTSSNSPEPAGCADAEEVCAVDEGVHARDRAVELNKRQRALTRLHCRHPWAHLTILLSL
jgi:hypothetical protein